MKKTKATPPGESSKEIALLVRTLHETEQRLRELAPEADSVLDPGGRSYLLREAQEKLQRTEATQTAILNALPAHIALLDREGGIISVNESWRQYAGDNALQDQASAVGQNYLEICERARANHAKEAIEAAAGIRSVLDGGSGKFSLEYPCHSPTRRQWFQLIASPVKTGSGGAVVMHLNITERKLAEETMRESEERLRLITNLVPHGIFAKDADGRHIFANAALAEFAGLSVGEILGRTDFDMVPDRAQAEAYRADDLAVMQSGRKVIIPEEARTDFAGRTRILQTIKIPFTVPETRGLGVLGVCVDITAHKVAEESLRESEERFRSMFTAAATGIAISTPHGKFLQVNAAYCQMLGYSEAELLARDFASLTHPDDLTLNLKLRDELLDGKRKSFVMEKRYLKKNGDMVWTRHSVSAVRAAGGKIERLIVVAENITERKHAQETLLKQQTEMQVLFDLMPAMLCFKDTKNVFLRVNQRLAEAAGRPVAEIEGKPAAEIFPRDATKYFADDLEVIQSRTAKLNIIEKLQSQDGKDLWVQTDKVPVCDQAGKVTGIVVMIQDITERKRAEEALVLFRTLIDQSNDSIEVVEPGTYRYLDVNESACTTHGYTRKEMLTMSVGDIDPDFGPALQERIAKELKAESRMILESRHRRKDGTTFPVEVTIKLVQLDKSYIVAMVRDITARKRAEESLVLFRALIDQSNDAIEVIEPDTYRFLDVNESACTSHRYTRQEMLSMTVGDIDQTINPALRERVVRELQTAGHMTFETSHRRKDGTTFPVEVNLKRVHLDKSYNVAIVRDITERKRTEARFRRLVNSNVQGVFFWNTKGEVTDGNDAFLKLAGYLRADLEAGRINWAAMTPPEYADLDQRALKELAATGICTAYEKEWIRKDGSRVPILLGAAVYEDNPDEGVCFALDLTEQKKLEEKFRRAQKMESFGQLAGGVAHDFNNILAVIQIQTDLFKAAGEASPEQSEFVQMIGSATQRAIALTRQLLLFSRKEMLQPRDLDLNKSINEMTNMLRRILGEHIEMQFKFSLQPLFIHADAGMIDQVVMNLAVNSRDAMPKGGRLVIETTPVDFDESVVAQSAQARPGAFVCLSVSDNGCGIPPENLSRIFEPFFTTKDVGKGTGLGLATVFGIVQQHRGWVNVYSEIGQGTTFRIYLPRLAGTPRQKLQPSAQASLPGGNETILLVEDDDFLRPSVRQTLSRLGYRVLEAGNGLKALEVWKQHRDEIHLVLTDLVMPGGMTGKDLGERLLQENPKLKVIYASGYSADIVSKDFPVNEGVNFLTKPFQTQKLAETIWNRLNRD